jgi:hypothetical protein
MKKCAILRYWGADGRKVSLQVIDFYCAEVTKLVDVLDSKDSALPQKPRNFIKFLKNQRPSRTNPEHFCAILRYFALRHSLKLSRSSWGGFIFFLTPFYQDCIIRNASLKPTTRHLCTHHYWSSWAAYAANCTLINAKPDAPASDVKKFWQNSNSRCGG